MKSGGGGSVSRHPSESFCLSAPSPACRRQELLQTIKMYILKYITVIIITNSICDEFLKVTELLGEVAFIQNV